MTKAELLAERKRLRRTLRACGVLLAATVISDPHWTEKQRVLRRRLLRQIPKVLEKR